MHEREETPLQSLFEICVLYCFHVINANNLVRQVQRMETVKE